MDDDNSGRLSYAEFAKGVQDFRVGVDEATTRLLFEGCDRDKSGEVDYDELLRMVRGPMNEFRKKFVWLAFNKLDKDGNGILEVSDIKDTYSAKNHPDVKAGRKSEEEVLGEFLETFEMHFNLGGGVRDRKITKEEFLEYYNNVSASIDDDQYFELMMVNGWKLHGEDLKMPGWKGEYGAAGLHSGPNKSVGAPYGVSDTPVEYRSAAKVQQETALHGESKASAPAPPATMKEEAKILVHEFRKCLATRGARGIFGIQRVFRVSSYKAHSGNRLPTTTTVGNCHWESSRS